MTHLSRCYSIFAVLLNTWFALCISLGLICFCNSSAQVQQRYRNFAHKLSATQWFIDWEPGLGKTLYMNNRFSEALSDTWNISLSMGVGAHIDQNSSFALFFSGFNHYEDPYKTQFIRLLNQHGKSAFGELIVNDVTEFRLGLKYTRFRAWTKHLYLSASLSSDLVWMSHSELIYQDVDSVAFIKAHTKKTKTGWALSPRLGAEYRIKYRNEIIALGLSYGLVTGFYPAEFEIWEGDNFDTVRKTTYQHPFRIFRQEIHLTVRIQSSRDLIATDELLSGKSVRAY